MKPITHFIIPDAQVRPDTPTEHLRWIGKYIVDKKPDVIVNIGDWADMNSLSSYDKGTKKAEGKRVHHDIQAANDALDVLMKPINAYNTKQKKTKHRQYTPRKLVTLGNHEERIMRHVNAHPELDGMLSYDSLEFGKHGFEVYDFLEPVTVDGVTYCHYVPNPFSGRPYGGTAANILQKVGQTFVCGHKQTLDIATRNLPFTGEQQWGIIAGACYLHDEDYKGIQGNRHWRGVIVLHDVGGGAFCPMFVDLEYLCRRYEGCTLEEFYARRDGS